MYGSPISPPTHTHTLSLDAAFSLPEMLPLTLSLGLSVFDLTLMKGSKFSTGGCRNASYAACVFMHA